MTDIRVCAVSDLHGHLPPLQSMRDCDLLVLAGDVCGPVDDDSIDAQRRWLDDVFVPWLERVPAEHVVGIAGNHDFILAAQPAVARDLPWHYLQDDEVELCGLRIWGTPWVPWLRSGFVFSAPASFGGDFLSARFAEMPDGLDILVSHSPPLRMLDLASDGHHAGSRALRTHIARARPRLVLCGHIHRGRGIARLSPPDGPLVGNVAAVDDDLTPTYGLTEFVVPPRPKPVRAVGADGVR